MIAEYTDRTSLPTTFRVAIDEPEDAAAREAALSDLLRRGARFPGNAAGFEVLGSRWEPASHTKSGGRKVAGKILVGSQGAALADGSTGPAHETAVYVIEEQPRLIVNLPDDLRALLMDLSSRTETPLAGLVRRAVREFLEREG